MTDLTNHETAQRERGDLPSLTLHRADCGCVGFRTSEFFMLVLDACDGEQERGFFLRHMADKTFTVVDPERSIAIVRDIQHLIADGYDLRLLRRVLGEGR